MNERPKPSGGGRARKRMIRTLAAATGVPYSVAARQLDEADRSIDWYANGLLATQGRTIYPATSDTHRMKLIEARNRRTFGQRVLDTRLAADLPGGRARHLIDRFPPSRGEPATGVGLLYHGRHREEALVLLYLVLLYESPDLAPSVGELASIAELGEETAVDIACSPLDHAARRLLDHRRDLLWRRALSTVRACRHHADWRLRHEAERLGGLLRTFSAGDPSLIGTPAPQPGEVTGGLAGEAPGEAPAAGTAEPFEGARQILDALLIIAEDGHAPGTRVKVLTGRHRDRTATLTGALWGPAGPPSHYEIQADGVAARTVVLPDTLAVLKDPPFPGGL